MPWRGGPRFDSREIAGPGKDGLEHHGSAALSGTVPVPAAVAYNRRTMASDARIEGGTVWLLRQLDVAEAIDLDKARTALHERSARRGSAAIRGPEKAPGGVVLA